MQQLNYCRQAADCRTEIKACMYCVSAISRSDDLCDKIKGVKRKCIRALATYEEKKAGFRAWNTGINKPQTADNKIGCDFFLMI